MAKGPAKEPEVILTPDQEERKQKERWTQYLRTKEYRDLKKALGMDKARWLGAFMLWRCNITTACKRIGIGRRTFYDWLATDEDFASIYADARESKIDWYISRLDEQAEAGNIAAIIYFLKTQAVHRGFSENGEVRPPEVSTPRDMDDVSLAQKIKKLEAEKRVRKLLEGKGVTDDTR